MYKWIKLVRLKEEALCLHDRITNNPFWNGCFFVSFHETVTCLNCFFACLFNLWFMFLSVQTSLMVFLLIE